MKKIISVAVMSLFCAAAVMADSTVQQKTKFRMGGALGGLVNMMGGGATREGVISTTSIKGNRRLRRTGDSGELVDLSEEKVYKIDFKDNTYKVVTFAEMRKQMEEMKAEAAKNKKESKKDSEKMPEFDVDVDVKDTGEKETINGFATHRTVITVTATEKGKKLKDSGGVVLTADMWLGPKIPAVREEGEFQVRFIQKVYGSGFDADMRQMAMVMASAPAFGKAIKKLEEKKGVLDGAPIRSELKFETVAPPGQASESDESASSEPSAAAMKMVGGLLGRMKKRDAEAKKEDEKPSVPGRSALFTSTTEVLKAEGRASAEAVALPAGSKLKS